MLVWFSDWQLAEERLLITVGDAVEWELYPADAAWVTRLFGDRLAVEWEYDTYGDAVEQPSRRVRGAVVDVRRVRCVLVHDSDGLGPLPGAAVMSPVLDTSGSWITETTAPVVADPGRGGLDTGWRSYTSIYGNGDVEFPFGYAVTLAVDDE
ncbi:DUF6578 domain-containing protein [Frondihabitans sp. 4ASC-45]|uniref:DUF6578 domain-containing protein n=1 Tax=Frondihabitans sp. 4ASC-45 TaxID=3111636 RepID=UPI003C141BC4